MTIHVSDTPEVREYLTDNDYNFQKRQNGLDVIVHDAEEAFQIGWDLSKEYHREKPEEFWLPTEYVPTLKEAIKQYSTDNDIEIDGIKIEEHTNTSKITVNPTRGLVLFGMWSRYGKLIQKLQTLKSEA